MCASICSESDVAGGSDEKKLAMLPGFQTLHKNKPVIRVVSEQDYCLNIPADEGDPSEAFEIITNESDSEFAPRELKEIRQNFEDWKIERLHDIYGKQQPLLGVFAFFHAKGLCGESFLRTVVDRRRKTISFYDAKSGTPLGEILLVKVGTTIRVLFVQVGIGMISHQTLLVVSGGTKNKKSRVRSFPKGILPIAGNFAYGIKQIMMQVAVRKKRGFHMQLRGDLTDNDGFRRICTLEPVIHGDKESGQLLYARCRYLADARQYMSLSKSDIELLSPGMQSGISDLCEHGWPSMLVHDLILPETCGTADAIFNCLLESHITTMYSIHPNPLYCTDNNDEWQTAVFKLEDEKQTGKLYYFINGVLAACNSWGTYTSSEYLDAKTTPTLVVAFMTTKISEYCSFTRDQSSVETYKINRTLAAEIQNCIVNTWNADKLIDDAFGEDAKKLTCFGAAIIAFNQYDFAVGEAIAKHYKWQNQFYRRDHLERPDIKHKFQVLEIPAIPPSHIFDTDQKPLKRWLSSISTGEDPTDADFALRTFDIQLYVARRILSKAQIDDMPRGDGLLESKDMGVFWYLFNLGLEFLKANCDQLASLQRLSTVKVYKWTSDHLDNDAYHHALGSSIRDMQPTDQETPDFIVGPLRPQIVETRQPEAKIDEKRPLVIGSVAAGSRKRKIEQDDKSDSEKKQSIDDRSLLGVPIPSEFQDRNAIIFRPVQLLKAILETGPRNVLDMIFSWLFRCHLEDRTSGQILTAFLLGQLAARDGQVTRSLPAKTIPAEIIMLCKTKQDPPEVCPGENERVRKRAAKH